MGRAWLRLEKYLTDVASDKEWASDRRRLRDTEHLDGVWSLVEHTQTCTCTLEVAKARLSFSLFLFSLFSTYFFFCTYPSIILSGSFLTTSCYIIELVALTASKLNFRRPSTTIEWRALSKDLLSEILERTGYLPDVFPTCAWNLTIRKPFLWFQKSGHSNEIKELNED